MENAVIGISLGWQNTDGRKVKNGRIEKSITRKINNKAPEDEILAEVLKIINEVKDDEVAGIGIGVPGLVDVEKGIVTGFRIFHPGAKYISKRYWKTILG